MPLAIRGFSEGNTACPTHQVGDLLLSFNWPGASTIDASWTSVSRQTYSGANCSFSCAYKIATTTTWFPPFTTPGTVRTYAITGSKTSDPIAGVATANVATSWQSNYGTGKFFIPTLSVPKATGTSTGSSIFFNEYSSGYGAGQPALKLPTSSAFTMGTGDFTIECWYNARSFSGSNNYLFDLGTNGTRVQFYNNQIYFNAGGATSVAASAGVGFNTGTWYHLAMVRSGTTVTGYINGTAVASMTYSANMTDNKCTIGSHGGSGGPGRFWGYISNFRVVKGTAVYTANFTPPTSPLTAIANTSLLTCTENSGTTISDLSSNNFTIENYDLQTAGAYSVFPTNNSPFASMNDGLRFSLATGIGGGGNSWNSGNTGVYFGGPGLSQVSSSVNSMFFEGGLGQIFVGPQPGYAGGSVAALTVSINPDSGSGFFAMF